MNSHSRSRVAADILLLLLLGVLSAVEKAPALGADAMVSSNSATGHFPLSHQGQAAALFVSSNDWPGVLRAVNDLGQDIQRVTGTQPQLIYNLSANPKQAVIIGTITRSPLIDQLVHERKIVTDDIVGKWESYFLQVVTNPFPNMETALVICGSDKRGTIYDIYDLAEQIGVSPWHYWSDNSAKKSAQLYIRPGKFVTGPPAVKYRGIFLNDEAPALSGWVEKNYGQVTGLRGVANYGRGFYTNVFELMLRLRANYLWPAMWNNAFNEDDPKNPRLADEYGIVTGTSHQEPMLRAQKEWDCGLGRQQGNWDYNKTNQRPALHQFWREGVRRNKACESIITMGLRAENYCFHDRDVAPEGRNLRETNKNFDAVAKVLQEEQKRTGIKLLWGTANLFSNPRYMHGVSTSGRQEFLENLINEFI